MKKYSVLLFFVFLFSNQIFAQSDYYWDDYNIVFTLADDFQEEVNNSEEFSAAGDAMYFSILPFIDASISDSDITSYTIEIAASLNLEEIDDVNVININDFEGGYVEGYMDGVRVFLMGLIDPNSETNFFVIITFLDNDNVALDEAVNMVTSIRKK